jgi:hypothetical protein
MHFPVNRECTGNAAPLWPIPRGKQHERSDLIAHLSRPEQGFHRGSYREIESLMERKGAKSMDDVVCRSRIQTASEDGMVDVCKLIFRPEPRGGKDHLEGWPSHTLVHSAFQPFWVGSVQRFVILPPHAIPLFA